ncbi:MAG: FHA domain-containing protein, partial [Planctomycetes bacterium]|nr:FHA domain-containing protein [Planctomycetota bacterium]
MNIGCLTIVGGGEEGKKILLKNLSVFEAGRSQGNHVYLRDETVAFSHFRIYRNDEQFSVYDLGTKRGTVVNGKSIDKVDLKAGDLVRAGEVEMRFELVDEETPGRLASS